MPRRVFGGCRIVAILIALGLLCIAPPLHGQTNIVRVTSITNVNEPGALRGNYLYCINSPTLRIFDISNPTNPVDVGYRNTLWCETIAFSGTYAYALMEPPQAPGGWFQILDASNPTNPVPVNRIYQSFVDFSVVGSNVYLFNSPNYSMVYDISDPLNPVLLKQVPPGFRGAVLDNFMYVCSANALNVWNISIPTNPITVASVPVTNNYNTQIHIFGNLLYVGNGRWRVFDISNRTNLVPINVLQGTGRGLAVAGNYCYLGSTNIDVFDITDPANARHVTSVEIGDGSKFPNDRGRLVTKNSYAYLQDFQTIAVCSLGQPPPPELQMLPADTNSLVLSWLAPTAAFAVQQTPNLASPIWTTLPDFPLVVDGRNQVILPAPPDTMFYRLLSQ